MNLYAYTAKNSSGTLVDGKIYARTPNDAARQLTQNGLTPVELQEIKESVIRHDYRRNAGRMRDSIGRRDVITFTRQMAGLAECHVPVLNGLRMMAQRCRKETLKDLIKDVDRRVGDGQTLSSALTAYPRYFSQAYVHMVKAAELSGQLGPVLTRLADMLEEHEERRAQVLSALYYPLFVLGIGVLTVTIMLVFVIPRLSGLFEEFNAQLPWMTTVLIHLSRGLGRYWFLILGALGSGFYGLYIWAKTVDGKIALDSILLRVPLCGPWIIRMEEVKILKMLGMLLENGIAMPHALAATCEITDHVLLKKDLQEILKKVKEGSRLSKALGQSLWFDGVLSGAAGMGEETGDLSRSLKQVAAMYEREADDQSRAFFSLLGPVLLLGIVTFVGFIVMALLMPIFEANFLMSG